MIRWVIVQSLFSGTVYTQMGYSYCLVTQFILRWVIVMVNQFIIRGLNAIVNQHRVIVIVYLKQFILMWVIVIAQQHNLYLSGSQSLLSNAQEQRPIATTFVVAIFVITFHSIFFVSTFFSQTVCLNQKTYFSKVDWSDQKLIGRTFSRPCHSFQPPSGNFGFCKRCSGKQMSPALLGWYLMLLQMFLRLSCGFEFGFNHL